MDLIQEETGLAHELIRHRLGCKTESELFSNGTALGLCAFASLRAFWLPGLDFVCGGVACSLEGSPHVPTGDGAVGAPAFSEGEEFFGTGFVFFAISDGPTFLDAEVVDG